MNLTVRPAVAADLSFLLEAAVQLREHEILLGYKGYAEFADFVEQFSTFLVLAENNDACVMLVAEVDGEKVGCLIGMVDLREMFYKPCVLGVVTLIHVEEQHRKAGIAKKMIIEFETRMAQKGVGKISCTLLSKNIVPQVGLMKFGYEKVFHVYEKTVLEPI